MKNDHASLSLLKSISETSKQFGLLVLRPQIEVCREMLMEGQWIDVAILGRFKAGKSSFLNSLMDVPVLPVGVIPVTAIITRLHDGENEKAEVRFLDGRILSIKIEDIGSYITESENPNNQKGIAFVDLELPSLKKYQGLRFVDTPGLGSLFLHNTETAHHWLPKVGAALVSMSVDSPLSQEDISFLREVRRYTPKVFLLLTKADLKTEEELEEIRAFALKKLRQEFQVDFCLFYFSTQKGRESWKKRIDEEIFTPLLKNREMEWDGILSHKLQTLVTECRDDLEIAHRAASHVELDCDQLKHRIFDEQSRFASIQEEIRLIARDCTAKTRPLIANHINQFQRPLQNKLTEELKSKLSFWRMNLWKLARAYESWLKEAFEREIREISHREREHFLSPLKTAQLRLTHAVEAFRSRLSKNIEGALGVKRSTPTWEIRIEDPKAPDVHVAYAFDIHLDAIWFLVPMFVFRFLFHRHFLQAVPFEVEKNLSRLASQWSELVNEAIQNITREAERTVAEEITTIESLLSQTKSRLGLIQETLEYLEAAKINLMKEGRT